MKKAWILVTLAAIFVVSAGLAGCQKKDEPADTKAAEKKLEDVKAPETPKDHPAH